MSMLSAEINVDLWFLLFKHMPSMYWLNQQWGLFRPIWWNTAVYYRNLLHYITCHLADAFIQSDLQLIRLSRRHTPWSNVGLRALLKGPTAVQILSWPHQGSNHRPCRSKSRNKAVGTIAGSYERCLTEIKQWGLIEELERWSPVEIKAVLDHWGMRESDWNKAVADHWGMRESELK